VYTDWVSFLYRAILRSVQARRLELSADSLWVVSKEVKALAIYRMQVSGPCTGGGRVDESRAKGADQTCNPYNHSFPKTAYLR
jgi:hypothetical protein